MPSSSVLSSGAPMGATDQTSVGAPDGTNETDGESVGVTEGTTETVGSSDGKPVRNIDSTSETGGAFDICSWDLGNRSC